MAQTVEEKNKALVLEAFETLFNKRDLAGAERFWSSGYIQHSAHVPPGRDGLFKYTRARPPSGRLVLRDASSASTVTRAPAIGSLAPGATATSPKIFHNGR
jgi:hypothetical protein